MKPTVALNMIALFILVLLLPLAVPGQSFEVHGIVESTYFLPDGATNHNKREFRLEADGHQVFIHTGPGLNDKGIDYHEFGTEGVNGFQLVKFQRSSNSLATNKVLNDATLTIDPVPEPRAFNPDIRHLWRAYVTQRELREMDEKYIHPDEPVLLTSGSLENNLLNILRERIQLRADCTFDDKPPFLLKQLVDFRDAVLGPSRHPSALIPDEFLTGYTNSCKHVVSWTNLVGLHLPIDTRVTTYIASTDNPEAPLQLRSTYRLLATNVAPKSVRTNFIPALSSRTRIVDHRFEESRNRVPAYISTNGVIQGTSEEAWAEVKRQHEAARKLREERERAKALEFLPEPFAPVAPAK